MNRPVLFLDSGIGGLPYAGRFHERNPGETFIYVADREHFPYGPRRKEDLEALLTELTAVITENFNPKLAVVACNTASVSALDTLRERFPAMPWVGTVPAVKPAVLASRSRCVGVLGTQRTVDDPYIAAIAAEAGPDCAIVRCAAPDLVDFVENRGDAAGAEEKYLAVKPYMEFFRKRGADGIVLGCTHFLFLLDIFSTAAAPDMRIYDSLEGVLSRTEYLLDSQGLRAEGNRDANLLILTGNEPPEPPWYDRALSFGLDLLVFGGDKFRSKEINPLMFINEIEE
jgi:glutamate racemase